MKSTPATNGQPDVIITQLSRLQRNGSRSQQFLTNLQYHFLIVDECHHWVRGQKSQMSNQLSFFRNELLPRASAVYLLSGTPFVGSMSFDMIETIKSLAMPARRKSWVIRHEDNQQSHGMYSDEALLNLTQNWESVSSKEKTMLLVPILLRRTADTEIDGQRIMPNFLAMLVEDSVGEIQHSQIMTEMQERELLLSRFLRDKSQHGGTQRYTLARWMSYSSWAITKNWGISGREDVNWWNGFGLKDAEEYERGRRLVAILKSYKREGKKPIIFAHAIFHQQFASMVLSIQVLS
jgi:hypothetical protein